MTKNCVITGAARGIGKSIAAALVKSGAKVVLSDIDANALEAAVSDLATSSATGVAADVCSAKSVETLAAEAERQLGSIDVWINNAGLARHRPIVDYTEQEIDTMLAVNLKGTILGSQAALKRMVSSKQGHIVNIVSTASLRGIPTESVYCSAKWGVRGFTQALAEEAAPNGIRVTALLPGGVDTSFWDHAVPERKMPVELFLSPDHIAEATISVLDMDPRMCPRELIVRALGDRDFVR